MSHILLESSGEIRSVDASEYETLIKVPANEPELASASLSELDDDQIALLEIAGSADGRAFSLLAQIVAKPSQASRHWVGGDLLPDQVTPAFQCGAKGVLISDSQYQERGKASWALAISPPVTLGYRKEVWSEVQNISVLRA